MIFQRPTTSTMKTIWILSGRQSAISAALPGWVTLSRDGLISSGWCWRGEKTTGCRNSHSREMTGP